MSSGPALVDSHCHLQQLAPDARERALEEARERGVRGFLVPATRLEEADDLLALCRRHPDVWCALGVHPHEASGWAAGDDRRLAELTRAPEVVAVGECGLDFHYQHSPREAQIRALRDQWQVAIDCGLPAVVHNRESDQVMLAEVRRPQAAGLRGDFHSFAGDPAVATELVARGFYFGVSGMVTFTRADNVRGLLPLVPLDRLLVETDTPYLAPAPHRGKPNRPAWAVEVAARVADEVGIAREELARLTTANFFRLFPRAARSRAAPA